jgi:uncharacterized protein (DUF2249 family)
MLKITNTLDIKLNVRGDELESTFKKLGLSFTRDLADPDTGRLYADEVEHRKYLANAVSFSWTAPIYQLEKYMSNADILSVANELDAKEVFKVYELNQVGFSKLEPGKSVEIINEPEFLDSLVHSGFADKITIEDTETGQIIWKGGIKEGEKEIYKNHKFFEEDKPTKIKTKEIYNVLHPDKLRQPYYPKKENTEENTQAYEEAKQKYVEKFGKQPHPQTKLDKLLAQINN